jgi:hypothetical protein
LNRKILPGVFILSAAILLLEVVYTRVFSVLFFYHSALSAISAALLGMAVSGVAVFVFRERFPPERVREQMALSAALFSFFTFLSVFILQRVRVSLEYQFSPFSAHFLFPFLEVCLVSFIPFLFGGFFLALSMTHFSRYIGTVYGFSMAGSALGGLMAIPSLNFFGGMGSLVLASLLGAVGAFSLQCRRKWVVFSFSVILSALLVLSFSRDIFPMAGAKSLDRTASFSRWNSFSHVAVIEDFSQDRALSLSFIKKNPGQPPPMAAILIDSFAYAPIVPARLKKDRLSFLKAEITSLPYEILDRPSVFIFGPGGGRDVEAALLHGSHTVVGADINPLIVHDIMGGAYREYSGNLYGRPGVHVAAQEARSCLRGDSRRYDLIMLNSVETWAAMASGALALTECGLFTRESIGEYLSRLKPGGILNIAFWDDKSHPLTRRLAALLGQEAAPGSSGNIGDRLAVFSSDAHPLADFVNCIFRNTPLDPGEVSRLKSRGERYGFNPVYLPGFPQERELAVILDPRERARAMAESPEDLSCPTDDRPFFFFTLRPQNVLDAVTTAHFGMTELSTVFLIFFLLAAVALCIFVPLNHRLERPGGAFPVLSYFGALGLGYMLVEILFLQQLSLFLSHPVYSFAVVLSALLLSSGLGSLASRKITGKRTAWWLFLSLVIICAVLLIYSRFLDSWLHLFLSEPLWLRCLIAALVTALPGFFMGFPFPLGVTLLAGEKESLIPWAWGINGAASIICSAVALLLCIFLGFGKVFFLAFMLYLSALALAAGERIFSRK